MIHRFSEDYDFLLCSSEPLGRKGRIRFKNSIIQHITSDPRFTIDEDKIGRYDKERQFKIPVQCDMVFNDGELLRPYLQLEMIFTDLRLPTSKQPVQSIISKLAGEAPETQLTCISPIETASDKISALTWRVVARKRGPNENEDARTLVRHLHDLAALKSTIIENKEVFVRCAQQSLQRDQESRGGEVVASMTIPDRLAKAHEIRTNDGNIGKNMKYTWDVCLMQIAVSKSRLMRPS